MVRGEETIVKPTITVTEKYESNSLFSSETENDWETVTMISPKIIFTKEYTKGSLGGSLGVDLEYFTKGSDLNNERYSAGLNFDFSTGPKSTFTFTENFSFTPDTLNLSYVPTSAIDTGIQVERNNILSNQLALSMNHKLSPAVSMGLTLSDSRTEYESSSLIDTKSNTIVPLININRALSTKTSLSSSYNYTRFSLQREDVKKYRYAHSLIVAVKHRFSSSLSFDLSCGMLYTPEKGFDYDFVGNTGLTRSTRKSQLSLSYSRRVAATSGLTTDIGISQGISLNFSSTLTKFFSIAIKGGINSNKSETSDQVDVLSYNSGVSTSWQPYTWISFNVGYSYFQQEANGTRGKDLTRNTISLNMNVVPTLWRL